MVQSDPVPPTILLVDGLNTDVQYQAQVHVQMIRMLRQLPSNLPVAVCLLGDRLTMLQSFTTDPRLLQAALRKATSTAGVGLATLDSRDDPDSVSSVLGATQGAGDPGVGVNSPAHAYGPGAADSSGGGGTLSHSHGKSGFTADATPSPQMSRACTRNSTRSCFLRPRWTESG